jgi:hypothetical protein
MPISVFAVVLFAAALHATWNAIVKGGVDKLLDKATNLFARHAQRPRSIRRAIRPHSDGKPLNQTPSEHAR